ncbi:MAG: isochorismatase family protein [Massilia sp.]
MRPISLTRGDALLIVDVQNDFLPCGNLAVPNGDEVLAPIKLLIGLYRDHGLPVYASRDWHPPEHCSFAAQGGPWPPHCVAHTRGAAFPDALALPPDAVVISKATSRGADAYSAFRDTGLAAQLRAHGAERLAVCGLATDYCVLNTVNDALALGFQVLLVEDAVRAVDAAPGGDGERALALMTANGAVLVRTRPPTLLNEASLIEAGASAPPPGAGARPARLLDPRP